LRLVTIFTDRISDSEAGQAEAQHCDKSQNIHMAQPSFLRFLQAGFYVNGGSQSLRRGLTAYHPGSPKEILSQFDRNFNIILIQALKVIAPFP